MILLSLLLLQNGYRKADKTRKPRKTNRMSTTHQISSSLEDSALNLQLFLITANVNGKSDRKGTAQRRILAICGFISKYHIIFVQESQWNDITRNIWKNNVPDNYKYVGNKQAGILFNENKLVYKKVNESKMRKILEEMIRKNILAADFTPLPRMTAVVLKTYGGCFLCVSWHGYHKCKAFKKIEDFENLQSYITELASRLGLPFIIGGDFNLSLNVAKDNLIDSNVKIYGYDPSHDRKGDTIDFFMSSEHILLEDIFTLEWTSLPGGADNKKIFDHVPVHATLQLNFS